MMLLNILRFLFFTTLLKNSNGNYCHSVNISEDYTNHGFVQDALKYQDKVRSKEFESESKSKLELQDHFYKKLNQPLQNTCHVLKKIGGSWRPKACGFLNGEKMVCMDHLYEAVMDKNCLIYSFGLSDNWDFEIAMANLGKL